MALRAVFPQLNQAVGTQRGAPGALHGCLGRRSPAGWWW